MGTISEPRSSDTRPFWCWQRKVAVIIEIVFMAMLLTALAWECCR